MSLGMDYMFDDDLRDEGVDDAGMTEDEELDEGETEDEEAATDDIEE